MLFTVIIPTCNRNEMLSLCLDRLSPNAQSLEAINYEVIVSDDGKNIDTKTLIGLNYPWAKWVEGFKRGPAANRNNGGLFAKGNWLVFTDDDCLPDRNWLMAYAKAIEEYPDCKAFEGAVIPENWALLEKDMAECPVNDKGGCFWSANIMIEKTLFNNIGGFDEQFKIAAQEDQDLQERVFKKTEIVFVSNAIIIHPVRIGSFLKRTKRIALTAINWHKYYRKNHGVFKTISKALQSQLLALISSVKKLRLRLVIYHLVYVISVVPILVYAEFKTKPDFLK